MRGALFLGGRKIEIRDFPDPTPGLGEVVIQMKASGMCGSDLKFYRPPPGEAQKALGLGNNSEPFIGGHEPCGVIAARGARRVGARGADRPARHESPLRGLRRLRTLPGGLVAALPRGHRGVRGDGQWRAR